MPWMTITSKNGVLIQQARSFRLCPMSAREVLRVSLWSALSIAAITQVAARCNKKLPSSCHVLRVASVLLVCLRVSRYWLRRRTVRSIMLLIAITCHGRLLCCPGKGQLVEAIEMGSKGAGAWGFGQSRRSGDVTGVCMYLASARWRVLWVELDW